MGKEVNSQLATYITLAYLASWRVASKSNSLITLQKKASLFRKCNAYFSSHNTPAIQKHTYSYRIICSASLQNAIITLKEVDCNINTNVLIPTHRSWRHSLSASLEDRARGGIRPRCCTNPRTMERWWTARLTNPVEPTIWLKFN